MNADHDQHDLQPHRRRLTHRTARLPLSSRVLYNVEHYFALPVVAIVATVAVVACFIAIIVRGFPTTWVATFELAASSVTLVMVFAIQHTQGREQAATQRKLDELIHAFPGAKESLMMLEEAPREIMLDVEDQQRDIRTSVSDTDVHGSS